MVRKTTREQLDRLTVKTLDQVFIAQAKEGLNCSLFEAQALTDLIKEVYFPWLSLSWPKSTSTLHQSAISPLCGRIA